MSGGGIGHWVLGIGSWSRTTEMTQVSIANASANSSVWERCFRWLLPLFIAVCGCGHRSGPTGSTEHVFRVPLDISLISLDPALVSDTWSIGALGNTFEGLVAMGEDNQVHPCLATSWKVSNDGRHYVFSLRSGVKFQGGRVLRAEDVKASLERACSKQLAAPLALEF